MTTPEPGLGQLLDELDGARIRLSLLDEPAGGDGARLRISAPRGVVTDRLRVLLAAHKAALVAHLEAGSVAAGPIRRQPRDGRGLPLAPNQRALWLLDQLEGHRPTYVVTGGVRFDGALDTALLGRCLDRLAERHETLRTAFRTEPDGTPVQLPLPPQPVPLEVVQARAGTAGVGAVEVGQRAAGLAARPFDLAAGRLLRATLIEAGAASAYLVLSVHHIIADAASLAVLFGELFALYRAGGDAGVLPALPVQCADVAQWRLAALSPVQEQRQLDYWCGQLDGAPALLELPTDRPRPARQSHRGAVHRFELDPAAVRGLAARLSVTPYTVLVAAWAVVLGRHAGTDDLVIGTPVTGRDRPETAGLVGFFVDTVALRFDLSGEPSFRELVDRVRRVYLAGLEHRDVPFEQLVARLRPDRSLGHSPVFQAMFVLYPAPPPVAELGTPQRPLTARPGEVHSGTAKFDLTLMVEESRDRLRCALEYAKDLFDAQTAGRLATAWRRVLAGALADPDTLVSRLPLLDPDERAELVEGCNDTRTAADLDRPVHLLLTEQARRTPNATAVEFGSERLRYAELDAESDRLAAVLRERGVGPDVLVGLCARRSLRLIVAMLAVLKSGGAFVAMDPESPPDRLAFTLDDSRAPLLLTERALHAKLPATISAQIILLDPGAEPDPVSPRCDISPDRAPERHIVADRERLAYVIYTSGSTGLPKGVAMRHEGLSNMVAWQVRRTPFAADDRVLQFAPLNFDICLQESFATWAAGGTLVLVGEDVRRDVPALLRYLVDERITRLFLPYVVLQQLCEVAVARGWWPRELRDVFAAGEQLHITPQLLALFEQVPATLHNHYGPTEAHVVTAHTLTGAPPSWPALPPVGRPIDNARIYLLDAHGEPVPRGTPGEVHVAGPCLARGYLHRDELTAAAFVADPFHPGQRMYRTGDLARLRPDGELEFLGRIDRQVKVRGFRVEPGEVETVLMRHPDVREAVVDAHGSGAGQRLVAWVVPRPGRPVDAAGLRAHCREALPHYLVPAVVVPLEALPLTNAGKIERSRLPDPGMASPSAVAFRKPATASERSVAAVVAQVLGLPVVGADDDFFDLGGHSLAATRVVLRLGAAHGVELPVTAIFERPTVAGIAGTIDRLRADAGPAAQPAPTPPRSGGVWASQRSLDEQWDAHLPPAGELRPGGAVGAGGTVALSFGQQRMWVLAQLLPASGAAAYVLCGAVHLRGRLDVNALRGALGDVVRRHDALRTVVGVRVDEPVAEIRAPYPVELPEHVVAGDAELDELARAEAARPFDLGAGPLLRATLVRCSAEADRAADAEAHLLLAIHHICADAWSLGVLFRELGACYAARLRGAAPQLAELPVRYQDFAAWQRRHRRPQALAGDVAYWRERLAGLPALVSLPADRPRPPVQSYRGAVQPYELPAELMARVHRTARETGTTPFMVLLAAWAAVLSRCGAGTDLPVGTPVAGRPGPEVEPLVGFFVNVLVLRLDLAGRPTFRQLLARVRNTSLAAFEHQDLPFEQLVEVLQPDRALHHSPLFQHMFILQNASTEPFTLPGLHATVREVHSGTAKFDLTLLAEEAGGGLRGTLEYATDLFDAATARRLLCHWRTLLDAALADPDAGVHRLPLLTEEERGRLLAGCHGPSLPVPAATVTDLLRRQAAATPDATALVFGTARLTYRELHARASRLAGLLRPRGVRPGALVAILLPRGVPLVVAVLGVLEAGAAYLPLDPSAPAARNAFILADAGATLLLCDGVTPAWADQPGVGHLNIAEADRDNLDCVQPVRGEPDPPSGPPPGTWASRVSPPGHRDAHVSPDSPAPHAATPRPPATWASHVAQNEQCDAHGSRPGDAAYVMYTSGSTGRPKGVVVEHRNVVNFFAAMSAALGVDGVGSWLAVTTVSFDISVLELLWTLCTGSTVVLQPDRTVRRRPARTVQLSLFYFASAAGTAGGGYRLLLEGAKFADRNGFEAVWTPERHFHEFGGPYPNPSVTGAAVAAVTERVGIRAGSVVLPLHDPLRVAEEWAVVDNLSRGRVGVSFASGWQAGDFVLAPAVYDDRRRAMLDGVATVQALWRGEPVERPNGRGVPTSVRSLPRPVQPELPTWITAAGSPQTFEAAGRLGANLLTHLLGQSVEALAANIGRYRVARAAAGHAGPGRVTLMLHSYLGTDPDEVRSTARGPLRAYLASSVDLIGSLARTLGVADPSTLGGEDLDALLDHAVDRYLDTSGLFGTPAQGAELLDALAEAGVDEVACLVDFGIDEDAVLRSLPLLVRARELHRAGESVPELVDRHGITHLQCTPSQAAMILAEPGGPDALRGLRRLLVGGEELPAALAERLTALVGAGEAGAVHNMYGPTETTVWSTTAAVEPGCPPLIGRPVANTTAYVLDAHGRLAPPGVPGELHLGGAGVARGYLGRPGLTAQRFVPDPFGPPGARLYRTGDLARYLPDGALELLGRTDHQVKIRGYRVELGELEAVLREHPAVAAAAATVHGEGTDRRLAGYVVAEPLTPLHAEELRDFLAARLPQYLVPAHLQVLPELPRTPNGKVDRGALPAPDGRVGRPAAVAPRDGAELRLAALWEDVLGVRPVGAHDDFFRLGGHSVLAVTLLSAVHRRFGRRLPLASLFQAPTVAGMARLLAADAGPALDRQVVVPLHPDGDVPLFVLPGAGGNLMYLHQLLGALPREVARYGLQPVHTGEVPVETLVTDVARRFVAEIIDVQPDGPYRLVGHSFGGYVAFELACQLRAAGREVALLAVLDTTAPLPERAAPAAGWDHATWLATVAGVFERLFRCDLRSTVAGLAGLAAADQVRHLHHGLAARDLVPPELDAAAFHGFLRTYLADQLSTYTPATPFDGPLDLLVAAELHPDNAPPPALAWTLQDPARGWSRFTTGPVRVHPVPGDHLSMLTPPHVTELAATLGDLIMASAV